MLNYANLNDVEFEYLCQDIMQKKLHLSLKRFAAGKDGGIDLRPAKGGNSVIIQVKHYSNSSQSKLLSALKQEIEKVKVLNPQQYYVCCSLTLSPQRTTEIFNMFSPFMDSEENIITLNEIEGFLQDPKNKDVLEKHYKLWIESTGVLERLLNRDVFVDCEVLLSDIKENIHQFVRTKAYDEALKCLSHCRTLFIIGEPGSGKTMTSKMLVMYFASHNYRVRYTTNGSSIGELKKALSLDPGVKEIIFLDDCLGQAYFQMKESQSAELLSLIKYINYSRNKYLILNSRVTIFQEAKERMPDLVSSIDKKEYRTFLLNMSIISKLEKAKILYNHLAFSGISNAHRREVIKDRKYRKIIDHKNYSPRIIEFITSPVRTEQIHPSRYFDFIKEKLDNPKDIWKDEYERRLQLPDRIFLLTLYSLSVGAVDEAILRKCYNYRLQREPEIDTTINHFEASLARLRDSFVKIVDHKGTKKISVINPSVNDFLRGQLAENELLLKAIINNSCAIEQYSRMLSVEEFSDFVKSQMQSGKALDLIYNNEEQKHAFIATFVPKYHILDERYTQELHAFLHKPYPLFIGYKLLLPEETIVKDLVLEEYISFYRLEKAISFKDIESVAGNLGFLDLVEFIAALSPLFFNNNREEYLRCSALLISEAIEVFCSEADVGNYNCNVGTAIDSASKYDRYCDDYYFDIDDVTQAVEIEVEEAVNYEIIDTIGKLPEDLQASIPLESHYNVSVVGAKALVESYYDDRDYEIDYYRDEGDQMDEIDTIFSR